VIATQPQASQQPASQQPADRSPPPVRPEVRRDYKPATRPPNAGPPRLHVVPPARPHRVPLVIGLIVVSVLTVAFGFAVFHSQMAATQYKIETVERELRLENERLADLQIQVQEYNSPAVIERLARGVIGLVDPTKPIDLVVPDEVLAAVARTAVDTNEGTGSAIPQLAMVGGR